MRGRKARVEQVREVLGYSRISTREQMDGSSLVVQGNQLRALAATHDRCIDRMLVDGGFSGGSLKRPAVQELLRCISAGTVSTVYVTKLDRLCRNLGDLLAIVKLCEDNKVTLISASESIDDSPAGKMMVSMLGAFAEFERSRIRERIRDVAFDKRQQRIVYSRVTPFGFNRVERTLVENPREQAALSTIRTMHDEGASYRQIARWLSENGYKPKGQQWYAASVKAVLESKMNAA